MTAKAYYEEKIARSAGILKCNQVFLQQIGDVDVAQMIALAIHNQQNHEIPPFIRQLSVPTTIHVLASLPNDIISIQSFESEDDTGCYFLTKAGDPTTLGVKTIFHKAETSISIKNVGGQISPHDLAVNCMELACCITDETTREIMAELIESAEGRSYCEKRSADSILDIIKITSDQLREKIGRSATFVVLPVPIARMLKTHIASDYDFDSLPINIKRIGMLRNRWSVYLNAYEQNKILVGYRGTHHADAGIAYSPYVLFWKPMKEAEKERYVIHKRYQVTMTRPDYYYCLEIAPNTFDSITEFL